MTTARPALKAPALLVPDRTKGCRGSSPGVVKIFHSPGAVSTTNGARMTTVGMDETSSAFINAHGTAKMIGMTMINSIAIPGPAPEIEFSSP
jgi:hypothetical protein